jgi:hypothetical protein
MPKSERTLIWECTPAENRFGCSECAWTFPNPQGDAKGEQPMEIVELRFQRHFCGANFKKNSIASFLVGAQPS